MEREGLHLQLQLTLCEDHRFNEWRRILNWNPLGSISSFLVLRTRQRLSQQRNRSISQQRGGRDSKRELPLVKGLVAE